MLLLFHRSKRQLELSFSDFSSRSMPSRLLKTGMLHYPIEKTETAQNGKS